LRSIKSQKEQEETGTQTTNGGKKERKIRKQSLRILGNNATADALPEHD
jgi:hypothetical protein